VGPLQPLANFADTLPLCVSQVNEMLEGNCCHSVAFLATHQLCQGSLVQCAGGLQFLDKLKADLVTKINEWVCCHGPFNP
jgi:hypothetical protein